jgi:hypothetical protein
MVSLKALPVTMVAVLVFICSREGDRMPAPNLLDDPVVKFLEYKYVSSRQGYLRKHPYATTNKTEKLSLEHVSIDLWRHGDQGTKQRYLQEKNPITQGFYRARVWLEVSYHKIPPELGIVLLIVLLVLASACAVCCCVTPCFYVYDHCLQHHRRGVSEEEEEDSKVADDPRTMKNNNNGRKNCMVLPEISAEV